MACAAAAADARSSLPAEKRTPPAPTTSGWLESLSATTGSPEARACTSELEKHSAHDGAKNSQLTLRHDTDHDANALSIALIQHTSWPSANEQPLEALAVEPLSHGEGEGNVLAGARAVDGGGDAHHAAGGWHRSACWRLRWASLLCFAPRPIRLVDEHIRVCRRETEELPVLRHTRAVQNKRSVATHYHRPRCTRGRLERHFGMRGRRQLCGAHVCVHTDDSVHAPLKGARERRQEDRRTTVRPVTNVVCPDGDGEMHGRFHCEGVDHYDICIPEAGCATLDQVSRVVERA
eukprot:scaffold109392_cov72-Phaeocystis_antarctica.AAC.4